MMHRHLIFASFIVGLFSCIHGKNVSFVPVPINITLAHLPKPFSTNSTDNDAQTIPVPDDPLLLVPDGFVIKTLFTDLRTPRIMLQTPTGNIIITETWNNRVSLLVDHDGDGIPDERFTLANETNLILFPYGIAIHNSWIYIANTNGVRRYPWTEETRSINGTGELVVLLQGGGHATRTLLLVPEDNKMYIGIGSMTDHDADAIPRATVQVADLDGKNQRTFATGLRNPTSIQLHPVTKELYVTCQERDEIGDDLVPDFFTRIRDGEFFGWPFAYLSSTLIDPRYQYENGSSQKPELVNATITPDVLFQAHSAALDMKFYQGNQFPVRYQNGAFAALHGSWNRANATGHKIVFIPFGDDKRPKGYYENFVDGFLTDPTRSLTFGRPTGILFRPDGSMLFTEDANNRLYLVQYVGTQNSAQQLVGSLFSISLVFILHYL